MNDILNIMEQRHSVRQYLDQPIEEEKRKALSDCLKECRKESGLNMQILYEEPDAFTSAMAHYGSFRNVRNYIALVGKKSDHLEKDCGYYGQKLVLKAQELGLNTCWVILTFSRKHCKAAVNAGEKLVCVIALGYGETAGTPHKNKPFTDLCGTPDDTREWFVRGMKAAVLAPTAMNQQKFLISSKDDEAFIKVGSGMNTRIDAGIVCCNFSEASGHSLKEIK